MKWPTSKNGTSLPPTPRHRHLAQSPHLRNLQCSPRETESADGLARPFHYLLTLFSVLSSPSCPVSALGREVLTAHPKLLTSYPAQVSPIHLVLIPIADWAPQLHWNWSLTLCNLALALLGCSEPPIDLTQFRMSSPRVSQMSRVSLDLACSYHSCVGVPWGSSLLLSLVGHSPGLAGLALGLL